ncbi:MAG: ABC transporter ATP-binding protein [Xanthomonadaceae bacterium]|nr:ABC transporter ATP-binding protein [Xanthomonadaceae bacterium]
MTSIAPPPPELALRVHGVSKVYRLWSTPAARLWVPLLQRLHGLLHRPLPRLAHRLQAVVDAHLHYHHALHGVDFSLHRGDALGIIGLNGSGKSTLLQIIAGVLQPSTGTVSVHGRIAALLELGSGFNMEMTGRENVMINAAVLGMTRGEIAARMDDIVAFADIGEYVDQPVKTYSSGMLMRLAFAVQVHVDPEILIVDEALSVGDARFQAKAMTRIDEILQRGTTLLFVGHDLNAVKSFCRRAMLLEKGRVVLEATPEEVITEYLYHIHADALRQRQRDTVATARRLAHGFGDGESGVEHALINEMDQHVSVRYGQRVQLALTVRVAAGVAAPQLILDVMDGKGLQITGRRIDLPPADAQGRVRLSVGFEATLQKGVYRFRMRLVDAPTLEQSVMLSRQEDWLSFDIVDDSRARFTGLFPLPMTIETG